MNAQFWKKVFLNACAWFTAITVLLTVIMMISVPEGGSVYTVPMLGSFRTFMIAIFCVVVSFAIRIYAQYPINEGLRLLLNYVLIMGPFMLFVFLPMVAENAHYTEGYAAPNPFVAVLILSVPYFLVYGVYRLISDRGEKKKAKEEYKPVYKKNGKK
ncbi:MAG: hypothetical protein IJX46_07620 [Clostridia bacterium]|nr:hypothetical protein [Clostridia bacterium]